MTRTRKNILIGMLLMLVTVAAVALYVWNKPRRSVSTEKGISVSATQLVEEYQANEAIANTKYLDKALEVTGTVAEVSSNQDGRMTIMLLSEDPMTGVFCTLKENTGNVKEGATVTVKGFCSGMLSDVRLREAVIAQ